MKPFKFFQKESIIMWQTAEGTEISIGRLRLRHIENIIRCLNGNGSRNIPRIYNGKSRQEWLQIMESEINRRHESI